MTDDIQPKWGRFNYEDWFDSWTVRSMSWKEQGLYGLLLKLQFKHGAIPANPKVCGRMLGVGSSGPEYEEFERAFEVVVGQFSPVENDPSRLRNARQATERDKAVAAIEQKIAAGRASGKSRRSNKNERPFNERSNGRSTDAATDIDVDVETDSSVLSEPGEPDVEKWNNRLAPLARELGGNRNIPDILKWCRDVVRNTDRSAQLLEGACSLRDTGQLSGWIEPGQPMGAKALQAVSPDGVPFTTQCEREWLRLQKRRRRKGPKPTDASRINVQIGGAA